MVRALDKADSTLTLSSALQYREPCTILPFYTVFNVISQAVTCHVCRPVTTRVASVERSLLPADARSYISCLCCAGTSHAPVPCRLSVAARVPLPPSSGLHTTRLASCTAGRTWPG